VKGYEIWNITKKAGRKTETAEMNLLRSVTGYTRKDQIRNTKTTKELRVFNYNN
jgi:hypothetical protein